MGLNNNTTSGGLSSKLTIVGGRFVLRGEEGTEGAESRDLTKVKNQGKTVWELKYKSLFGYITSGIITDGEYPGVDIMVEDGGDSYELNFPLDSRYLFDMIKRLPNMDMSKPVNIEVVEGKKKTRTGNPTYKLHLVQDGHQIHDYYIEWKKDSQGNNIHELLHGIPDAVEGRKGWSFEAQEDFLLCKFEEFFSDFQAPEVADDSPTDQVPAAVTDAGEPAEEAPADFEEPLPF